MVGLILPLNRIYIFKNSGSRTPAGRKRKRDGTLSEVRSGSRPSRDQSGISAPEVKTALLSHSILRMLLSCQTVQSQYVF